MTDTATAVDEQQQHDRGWDASAMVEVLAAIGRVVDTRLLDNNDITVNFHPQWGRPVLESPAVQVLAVGQLRYLRVTSSGMSVLAFLEVTS